MTVMISYFHLNDNEDIMKMSAKVIPAKESGFLAQEVEQAANELGAEKRK